MLESKIFLDTNILIYSHDISAGEKHKIAQKILLDLWNSGNGLISTQVLQEFFVVVTKKIPKPLDIKLAKEIISNLLKWEIVIIDGETILKAIEIHSKHQYSFWDCIIIQTAIKGSASILFSEDLEDGKEISGVKIKNPFV